MPVACTDIRNWRRSPLRELLMAAAAVAADGDGLHDVRAAMKVANDKLNDLEVIKELGGSIGGRLVEMVGDAQAVETRLAATPDEPAKLIRAMKLFVDGDANRPLSSASLDTLNVLYLALQELGLDARMVNDPDIAHVVMAIGSTAPGWPRNAAPPWAAPNSLKQPWPTPWPAT